MLRLRSPTEIRRKLIRNQEEHDKAISFKEELIELLKEHGVEYDEKYLL
jgi:hypothetical protein